MRTYIHEQHHTKSQHKLVQVADHLCTVGWGEYGTAGVKMAQLYLLNGSPERDKFILKVDLKIQIKGTL